MSKTVQKEMGLDQNKATMNALLGLAPSSLGLQELASQVGSINYPLALMVSPA